MNSIFTLVVSFVLLSAASVLQAQVICVDDDAVGANDGTSWANAYTSLAAAIEASDTGDEIWVAAGTYGPIALKNNLRVLGGFEGTEGKASTRNPQVHKTTIFANNIERAVRSINNDRTTVLDGFTVTGGRAVDWQMGGGLYLERSDAMVSNCVFETNTAHYAGGAIGIYGGSPLFDQCRFVGNGSGENQKGPYGGGAIFNHHGTPAFRNCLFDANQAAEGGAVAIRTGEALFSFCTFVKNRATQAKGGAIYDPSGASKVRDSILWNNSAAQSDTNEIYNDRSVGSVAGTTAVSNSVVSVAWPGEGNLDQDPMFIDAAKGDYRTQSASPAANRGYDPN